MFLQKTKQGCLMNRQLRFNLFYFFFAQCNFTLIFLSILIHRELIAFDDVIALFLQRIYRRILNCYRRSKFVLSFCYRRKIFSKHLYIACKIYMLTKLLLPVLRIFLTEGKFCFLLT